MLVVRSISRGSKVTLVLTVFFSALGMSSAASAAPVARMTLQYKEVKRGSYICLKPCYVRAVSQSYDDQNNNGRRDGEPFTDSNGNSTWDSGEPFTDSNGNNTWETTEPNTTDQWAVSSFNAPFSDIRNGRTASWTLTKSGNYTIDVRARNGAGETSSTGDDVVVVKPDDAPKPIGLYRQNNHQPVSDGNTIPASVCFEMVTPKQMSWMGFRVAGGPSRALSDKGHRKDAAGKWHFRYCLPPNVRGKVRLYLEAWNPSQSVPDSRTLAVTVVAPVSDLRPGLSVERKAGILYIHPSLTMTVKGAFRAVYKVEVQALRQGHRKTVLRTQCSSRGATSKPTNVATAPTKCQADVHSFSGEKLWTRVSFKVVLDGIAYYPAKRRLTKATG